MIQQAEYIEIQSSCSLSPEELTSQRQGRAETPHNGLKRTHFTSSIEEQEELNRAYVQLRAQLCIPRIERLAGRSIAIWHSDQHVAEVVQKNGKFEYFGHSVHGKLYLEYYETLFMLELGRLVLKYHRMIVSVEQAYLLLLGEEASEKYNIYFVYSAMCRLGYIVMKHQSLNCATEVTREDCVWSILQRNISQKPVPSNIMASPLFLTTESKMELLKKQITSPDLQNTIAENIEEDNCDEYVFKFDTGKRILDSKQMEISNKKWRNDGTTAENRNSLLDNLKTLPEYRKFKEIFTSIDIIQLHRTETFSGSYTPMRQLKIVFDLYLHNTNDSSKRLPKSPNFSVILLHPNESFPTNEEMVNCQNEYKISTPLLVVCVSESKQIQAFIYFISS